MERTRLLLHMIDVTSEDAIAAYMTIQHELDAYGRGLARSPPNPLLSKIDALPDTTSLDDLARELHQRSGAPVFLISAVSRAGLDQLMHQVWQALDELTIDQSPSSEVALVKR